MFEIKERGFMSRWLVLKNNFLRILQKLIGLRIYLSSVLTAFSRIPSGVRIMSVLLLCGWMGYQAIPLSDPLFPNDYSRVILDENNEILRVFLNTQQQWMLPPEPKRPIPNKLKQAVLEYEDRNFYQHQGVHYKAVLRALYLNVKFGKVMSGASTITMQVARLARPKKRTYINKLFEMFQAMKLEIRYNKTTLLHLYLDHAPYGGNIKGYQAAAWKYFGKPADSLTWSEAATLAVLPNSPSLITPVVNRGRLIQKRNQLLQRLTKRGLLDAASYAIAVTEPVPEVVRPFPFYAPHATRWLRQAESNSFTTHTTLNRKIQSECKEIVKRHLYFLQGLGIRNVSVVVADTKTGEVKAYIGSQGFFDKDNQGQVDGVQAQRSPGSILKPFLYALAMDEGILLPDMQMRDIPTHFNGFSPQNYTKTFQGLVPAREALIQSLNVPAVRLLNTYGIYSFYLFLKASGQTTLFRTADEYGLSLILGGSEVTLWEMVGMYRGLGNRGFFQPLRILANRPYQNQGQQLIHPASVFNVLDILRDVRRPGGEYYWEQYNNQRPVAWKTGTSYGNRDAWAIGTNPKWTIGIWVGNFTGEGNPNLSGARCAGPLLFDCFNAFQPADQTTWFSKPYNQFTPGEVCLETGFMATEHCPKRKQMDIPKHTKPFRRCPFHKPYHFAQDQKHTVCSLCWKQNHIESVRLVYPPHIMHFMRKQGHRVSKIPAHNPKCPSVNQERAMDIVYPTAKTKIWVPRGMDGNLQKIIVQVTHRDRASRVFWYLDGVYLGETRDRHDKAVTVSAGWHTIQVVDEHGEKIGRRFQTVVRKEMVRVDSNTRIKK
jgi:penicillin-binding protein 1C